MVDLSSSMRRSENGCQEETRARVTSSWLSPGNFCMLIQYIYLKCFQLCMFLHTLYLLVFISDELISMFSMLFSIRLSDLSYGTA